MNPYVQQSGAVLSWVIGFEHRRTEDFQTIYVSANDLYTRLAKEATEAGLDAAKIALMQYAWVALIDETVLQSHWNGQAEWQQRSLQMVYFQHNRAGEVFFEKLTFCEKNKSQYLDILEVFYLCLQCGFQGYYRLLPPDILQARIEALYATIAPQNKQWCFAEPLQSLPRAENSFSTYKILKLGGACLVALYLILLIILNWQSGTLQNTVLERRFFYEHFS